MTAALAFVSDGLFALGAAYFVSALFCALGKGALKKICAVFTVRRRFCRRETPAARVSGGGFRAFIGGCCWVLSGAFYFLWLSVG